MIRRDSPDMKWNFRPCPSLCLYHVEAEVAGQEVAVTKDSSLCLFGMQQVFEDQLFEGELVEMTIGRREIGEGGIVEVGEDLEVDLGWKAEE
jgi:hypothetical protein